MKGEGYLARGVMRLGVAVEEWEEGEEEEDR